MTTKEITMPQAATTEPVDNIIHEHYCRPRPDTTEVRTERYTLPRPSEDGLTSAATVEIHRCVECGSATYDGVPERQLAPPPRRS